VNAVVLARGSMQNALVRIKSKRIIRIGALVLGSTYFRKSDFGNALSLDIEYVILDATVIPLKPDINVTRIISTLIPLTK
jgi:hypothetical protein